jgi:trigger factor
MGVEGVDPLNITAERVPDSQVVLTIEVDQERVEKSMDRAYRKVVPRVRVPGFRPGKAPRAVLERHVGRETLLHEALDMLVPEIVEEAIKAQDLQMVDRPDLEISSLDPVVIKATVPVRPTIDLGAYREIRVEPEPVTVDETEVEKTLEGLRRRYATIEPVERPVEDGDRVRVNLTGMVEGRRIVSQDDAELSARAEALTMVPGVYEHILGMSKGDIAEFDAELPEDYGRSEFAGKTMNYRLEVLDVKAEILPDLDDEFAKGVGEGFESLQALRDRVTEDINTRQDEEAKRKLQEQALEALVAGATMEYPPQLVEREIDHILRDLVRPTSGDRASMERFLQQVGRSEDALREQFRPSAEDRVRRTLALSQLAELEGIEVSAADVQSEIENMAGGTAEPAQIRALFDTPSGREVIERQLHTRLTLERLTQIARGEAPEPPQASASEAAAASDAGEATSADAAVPAADSGAGTTAEAIAAPPVSEDQQEETTPA